MHLKDLFKKQNEQEGRNIKFTAKIIGIETNKLQIVTRASF